MAVLYLVLSIGAVTTLYPFLLMVSTGLKGPTDQNDNRLVPSYLTDRSTLLAKYLDDKYSGDPDLIASTRIGGDATPEEIARYREFLMRLPLDDWMAGFRTPPNGVTGRLQIAYTRWLRNRYQSIDQLNVAYREENVDFQTVVPPTELLERSSWHPDSSRRMSEWREFKNSLPAEYRIPMRWQRMFQAWIKAQAHGQFSSVPARLAGAASGFDEISLPRTGPELSAFLKSGLPDRYRHGSLEEMWSATNPKHPVLPIVADEQSWLTAHSSSIRSEFETRNYAYVLDYILLNGRAVWNTVLFCFLAIATQLIVNPVAAYALSRYPIRASGAILIFLLATMAFPAEVAAIPSFLLLKGLGLLNTFAALVLPSAASGYMIFLLKGFFDSLPQELFEAGAIDGAKESAMMMRIAIPLSRPVLGYLALTAFMGAYGAFLYAFLVAQDQRIWTLMVWIYQLQVIAPRAVTMAALTLAAIPTLVVFLLAQRVIMRGIVLPGER